MTAREREAAAVRSIAAAAAKATAASATVVGAPFDAVVGANPVTPAPEPPLAAAARALAVVGPGGAPRLRLSDWADVARAAAHAAPISMRLAPVAPPPPEACADENDSDEDESSAAASSSSAKRPRQSTPESPTADVSAAGSSRGPSAAMASALAGLLTEAERSALETTSTAALQPLTASLDAASLAACARADAAAAAAVQSVDALGIVSGPAMPDDVSPAAGGLPAGLPLFHHPLDVPWGRLESVPLLRDTLLRVAARLQELDAAAVGAALARLPLPLHLATTSSPPTLPVLGGSSAPAPSPALAPIPAPPLVPASLQPSLPAPPAQADAPPAASAGAAADAGAADADLADEAAATSWSAPSGGAGSSLGLDSGAVSSAAMADGSATEAAAAADYISQPNDAMTLT